MAETVSASITRRSVAAGLALAAAGQLGFSGLTPVSLDVVKPMKSR